MCNPVKQTEKQNMKNVHQIDHIITKKYHEMSWQLFYLPVILAFDKSSNAWEHRKTNYVCKKHGQNPHPDFQRNMQHTQLTTSNVYPVLN